MRLAAQVLLRVCNHLFTVGAFERTSTAHKVKGLGF